MPDLRKEVNIKMNTFLDGLFRFLVVLGSIGLFCGFFRWVMIKINGVLREIEVTFEASARLSRIRKKGRQATHKRRTS